MMSDVRTATITAKGQIAIPKEARKRAGFKEGDKIVIITHKDHVELRALPKFSEAMEAALLSQAAFAKDWDTPEEDEAWKDL
jgi:AbrB family looped-hinge helix DNA binding protein